MIKVILVGSAAVALLEYFDKDTPTTPRTFKTTLWASAIPVFALKSGLPISSFAVVPLFNYFFAGASHELASDLGFGMFFISKRFLMLLDTSTPKGGAVVGGITGTFSTMTMSLIVFSLMPQLLSGTQHQARGRAALYRFYYIGRLVIPAGILAGALTGPLVKYRNTTE